MSELGPIGHLPVNEQQAREAADGPRTTVPKFGQVFFSPVRRDPLHLAPRSDQAWRRQAACRGIDVNLFYPESGEPGAPATQARLICETCPVRQPCADAGLGERFGIWGGLGPDARKRIRVRTKQAS